MGKATMKLASWVAGALVASVFMLGGTARADWVKASGFADPEGKWTNEGKVYDLDPATYGVDTSNRVADGAILSLKYGAGVRTNRLRFSADRWPSVVDWVRVTVYYGGANGGPKPYTFSANAAEDAADGYPNARYKYLDIEEGVVTQVDFMFHYKVKGYYFWLYACEVSAVSAAPMGCQTLEPSSVREKSVVFNAKVTGDGGKLCAVRFKYRKDSEPDYKDAGILCENLVAGDTCSGLLGGVVAGQKYYVRAEISNETKPAGLAANEVSFVCTPEEFDDGSIWVAPFKARIANDDGEKTPCEPLEDGAYGDDAYNANYPWESPELAADGWEVTGAREYHEILDAKLWGR